MSKEYEVWTDIQPKVLERRLNWASEKGWSLHTCVFIPNGSFTLVLERDKQPSLDELNTRTLERK